MSTIVVVVQDAQPSTDLLKKLRDATQLPISAIQAALTSGTPLLKSKLYFNDHEERARELRDLVRALIDTGTSAYAFEIEEGDEYVEGSSDYTRFDLSQILEILAEWDRRLSRIHELDDKRGGGP